MTRKDYQAIARILYLSGCRHGIGEAVAIMHELAAYMERDNPRFNQERFIEACTTGTTRGMRKDKAK